MWSISKLEKQKVLKDILEYLKSSNSRVIPPVDLKNIQFSLSNFLFLLLTTTLHYIQRYFYHALVSMLFRRSEWSGDDDSGCAVQEEPMERR